MRCVHQTAAYMNWGQWHHEASESIPVRHTVICFSLFSKISCFWQSSFNLNFPDKANKIYQVNDKWFILNCSKNLWRTLLLKTINIRIHFEEFILIFRLQLYLLHSMLMRINSSSGARGSKRGICICPLLLKNVPLVPSKIE